MRLGPDRECGVLSPCLNGIAQTRNVLGHIRVTLEVAKKNSLWVDAVACATFDEAFGRGVFRTEKAAPSFQNSAVLF